MSLYDSKTYMNDILDCANQSLDWSKLAGKSIAISGGTGMIGSYLVDLIMYRNKAYNQQTDVYVFGRNEQKANDRFSIYADNEYFHFVKQDINQPIAKIDGLDSINYVIHAASNTHPVAYASDPIGTISANVIGTSNLLEWASSIGCDRFVFLSSVEIYGENKGDIDKFDESYLGYIDCNTMRAGYPESKRTGEAMCQAYIKQKNMDIVIPRLSRIYGPTMLSTDTKAMSQFILKGVHNENIVLKSEGTQEYSYAYVADAVLAILKIMFDGICGESYNVASDESDIMLKDLAKIIADYNNKEVVFELPDAVESAGYSKATKATLDVNKLKNIGWVSNYTMVKGLHNTIDVLKEIGA